MAAEHTRAGRFQAKLGGLVLFCVVNAYLTAPLLRFCPPGLLAGGGVGLGGAALLLFEEWVSKPNPRDRKWKMVVVSAGFGVGCLIWAMTTGMNASNAVDRLCRSAQAEMLGGRSPGSSPPKLGQADAKDRFQALGCRYQTLS